MRSPRFVGALLLIAACLFLAAAGFGEARGAGEGVPQLPLPTPAFQGAAPGMMPPPLPAGAPPDLDLVFTAQVAGWIEPCG